MMKKLPWILLAVSIIFNFTFAGGFLHARSGYKAAEAPEPSPKIVADEFNLTEDQTKVFAELRAKARMRAREIRESVVLARQDLWSEISSDSPDPQRIREIQDRLAELYRECRGQSSEHLRRFLGVLSPEQRKAVMERIRAREPFRRGGRRVWERFDTNGDGKLDEAERARARKHFHSRRGRSRKPFPRHGPPRRGAPGTRPPRDPQGPRTRRSPDRQAAGGLHSRLLERFDADGNGELSDDERARARRSMDTLRGHRPPPQWMLDRSDTDRDGKLDPEERQAAMRAARESKRKSTGPSDPDRTASPRERK